MSRMIYNSLILSTEIVLDYALQYNYVRYNYLFSIFWRSRQCLLSCWVFYFYSKIFYVEALKIYMFGRRIRMYQIFLQIFFYICIKTITFYHSNFFIFVFSLIIWHESNKKYILSIFLRTPFRTDITILWKSPLLNL